MFLKFEFIQPMWKRVNVILIYSGFVFIMEFKINATKYLLDNTDQCFNYALDLKNFQEKSMIY